MKEQMKQGTFEMRLMKAVLGFAVVCLMVISMTLISRATSTGTVKSSNVNVRSSADANSAAVGTVTTNDAVTINEEVTGADGKTWYKITTGGGVTGYVRSDFVTKSAELTTTAPTANVTAVDKKTAYVEGTGSVRIRSDATTSSNVVATAGGGTEVTITGEATAADGYKWYQISFTGNGNTMTGFIRSDLVTFEAPAQTPEVTEIAGQMGDDPVTEPAADPAAEGGVTDVPVENTEEATETPTDTTGVPTTAKVSELVILEPVGTPSIIPNGFEEVDLNLGETVVTAWAKGDFYLLYAMKGDSAATWYLYDYKNAGYVVYDGLLSEEDVNTSGANTEINFKLIVIILVVVIVILMVVIAILGIKLNNMKYDDYDDYDDEDDDDYEDEEPEYEIDEEEVQKKKVSSVKREPEKVQKEVKEKKTPKAKKKLMDFFTVEVDDDDDDDYEDYDEDSDEDSDKDDINFIDL